MDAVGCGTFYLAGLSACWSLIFCKFLVRVSHSLDPSGSGLGDMKKKNGGGGGSGGCRRKYT